MAIEDKLVTLGGLQVVNNKINAGIEKWQDITSSLSWSAASYLPQRNGGTDNTGSGSLCRTATIACNAHEIYRVTGWGCTKETNTVGISSYIHFFPIAVTNNQASLTYTMYYDYENPFEDDTQWYMLQRTIAIPQNSPQLQIYDYTKVYNSSLDWATKVEKLIN